MFDPKKLPLCPVSILIIVCFFSFVFHCIFLFSGTSHGY